MGHAAELHWGTRSTVDVGGVSISAEVAGPAAGQGVRPTLALLHGFASGTFTWAGTAPELSLRHRVVAWDRPPFGRSDRPRPPRPGMPDPYGMAAALDHATAVLDVSDTPEPLVLVGHSAGCAVALELARHGARPVAGLVLIAPALDAEPPRLARGLLSLPGASTVGVAGLAVATRGARLALRRLGQHGTPLMELTGAETARTLQRPGTAAALVHLTRTWTRPALLDTLGPLPVPVLVIGGADDRISRPASTRALAETLGAELVLLDDVGHAPQEQVPDVVASLVAGFAADCG